MVFGIVIVNAACSRGIDNSVLLTRYTMWRNYRGKITPWFILVYLSFGSASGSNIQKVMA